MLTLLISQQGACIDHVRRADLTVSEVMVMKLTKGGQGGGGGISQRDGGGGFGCVWDPRG